MKPETYHDPFKDPNQRQQRAIEQLNMALVVLAAAFSVDPDMLNEVAGEGVETAIWALQQDSTA